jgi:hypothetical protein
MGILDSFKDDRSYCGWECSNMKCSRNGANVVDKNSESVQWAYYEDCDNYAVPNKMGAVAVNMTGLKSKIEHPKLTAVIAEQEVLKND